MVGVLRTIGGRECFVSATEFSVKHAPSKVYLGYDRTLPQPVMIDITFIFRTEDEQKEFFQFWTDDMNSGARPFYIKLPLFGETKFYLIIAAGNITHKVSPRRASGTFELYRTRAMDDSIPPVLDDSSFSFDMDSSDNYIYIEADSFDSVTYEVSTPPAHGVVTNAGDGVFYYTPERGYYGNDSFVVTATDIVGAKTSATVTVEVVNWKLDLEFTLTIDDAGHLHINYSNTVDAAVQAAVDDLSNGHIEHNGEFTIDPAQTQHIADIYKDADDQWIITPK